jgi:negative regulator of genetic competence, sporulation and motility
MSKVVVLNYATSDVDIIDFNEKDIDTESWLSKRYNMDECYYMEVLDNSSLNISFLNSSNM